MFLIFIKNLKTQMTSQNVALCDINIALWALREPGLAYKHRTSK